MASEDKVSEQEEVEEKKISVDPRSYNNSKASSDSYTRKRKKIVQLRGKGKTWTQIGKEVNLSHITAKKIYEEEIALGTVTHKRAASHFNSYIESMEKRYGEIVETVDRLHDLAKKAMEEFESEDMSDMKTYVTFIKSVPSILQIVREIKEQIAFLREEQSRIKVEQKNYIYSPTQINTHLNKTLNYLHEHDYIRILKKLPFDN